MKQVVRVEEPIVVTKEIPSQGRGATFVAEVFEARLGVEIEIEHCNSDEDAYETVDFFSMNSKTLNLVARRLTNLRKRVRYRISRNRCPVTGEEEIPTVEIDARWHDQNGELK